MGVVPMNVKNDARITKALLRLSSARREKLSEVDFETFLDGLLPFDPVIVERVCDEFGLIAPEEFQPRFPPLYQLRERCFRAVEQEREKRLALKAPELSEQYPPIDPERFEEIKARFRAVLEKKSMPRARAAGDLE